MKGNITTRQTIKGSIYSYLGVVLGFVNIALLTPMFFSTDEIGLTQLLISVSAIAGQIATLGFPNAILKTFPKFRNKENNHNGFGFLITAVSIVGIIGTLVYFFIDKERLIAENLENSSLFSEYVYLLIPLFFSTILYLLFDTYNRVLFNASFGLFVKELFVRILNTIGIVLFLLHLFDFQWFIYYYTAVYSLPAVAIIILLLFKKELSLKPDFSIFKKEKGLRSEVLSVSFWGLIVGFANLSITQFDKLFVNKFMGLGDVGIYSIMLFFGSVVAIPVRSYVRITTTIISQSFKENNLEKIKQVYKNSVIFLTFFGMLFFVGIWGNINNILQILKPEYAQGKYVILLVGIGSLFTMSAGASSMIINMGKYYRYSAIITAIYLVAMVALYYLLIPKYGITGAGITYMVSLFIYNILSVIFVRIKYKFQPYNYKFLLLLLFGTLSYGISLLLPQLNLYLDICIRSIIISIVFLVPIYFMKIVPELNAFVNKYLSLLKFPFGK